MILSVPRPGENVNDKSLQLFGNKLRALRIARDLSITEAAAQIGITREYLSKVEHGHKEVCLLTLLRIAKAYGVKPSELLDG